MKLEPLHPLQVARFRAMTHEEKWAVTLGMIQTAREVRRSAIRNRNPNWADDDVEKELAREFARARS